MKIGWARWNIKKHTLPAAANLLSEAAIFLYGVGL